MADTFQLKVVTPDGAVLDKKVASVSATTEAGEITVLPEHRLLLSSLLPGPMTVRFKDADDERFVLDSGFLEAGPDHVNIICDHCAKIGELDRGEIDSDLAALKKQLDDADPDGPTADTLNARLAWKTACQQAASES